MTDWLKVAQDSFNASTTYVDSNYRKKWEDALSMFQSKHPAGSKYHTDTYKHRSKLFRPKTRSVVRRHEAAAAAAFFSNTDIVEVSAIQSGNKQAAASAELMKEVLNYRLTNTIPWFQTLIGGFQDALTVGVVCSYQYWKYKGTASKSYQSVLDEMGQQAFDESGVALHEEVETQEATQDEPCVELIPIENMRIDPGANWIDPINSSPYVIRLIPMYIVDIKAMMERDDPKTGVPKWKKLTDDQLNSASKLSDDSTRQVREGKREDSTDQQSAVSDFSIVWVHENIVRIGDEEMQYFTLGTEYMLTDATPLKEVYFHGERPYTMGCSVIETHKNYPEGIAGLGEQLQREANDIANQRMDNVKLVLNKRYIVKRGAQVDLKSLVRNVPASITLANDPSGDVQEINFPDVTGSSYQEQDRINVDYDELTGNFAASSIQTNRTMNDTVGGMRMLSQGANSMTEYTIRTFTETWVEKVLKQLVLLEQAYETDEVVLAIAADKAKLWQKFGVDQVTDDLMKHQLVLTVNVGMNATDPGQRMNQFVGALMAVANVAKAQVPDIDIQAVGQEIFGIAGYKDGARFMQQQEGQDPKLAQAQQIMQQMQQRIQQLEQGDQAKMAQTQAELQAEMQQHVMSLRAEMQSSQLDAQTKTQTAQIDGQIKLALEQMKEEAAYDREEIKGLIALMTQAMQPPPELASAVSEDMSEGE